MPYPSGADKMSSNPCKSGLWRYMAEHVVRVLLAVGWSVCWLSAQNHELEMSATP